MADLNNINFKLGADAGVAQPLGAGTPYEVKQGLGSSLAGKKAVLYLFSTRVQQDTVKRPLLYDNLNKFEVLNAINEKLYNSQKNAFNNWENTVDMSMSHIQSVLNLPEARAAIVPAYDGIRMKTSAFSENWMFMLIIDNDDRSHMSRLYKHGVPSLPSRCIYYGICVDEPVNPVNMGQGYTPNYNSTLMVTHKTILNQSRSFTPTGDMERTACMADVDVVHGQLTTFIADRPLFDVQPANLISKVDISPEDGPFEDTRDTVMYLTDSNDTINADGPFAYATKQNIPTKHLETLLTGTLGGISQQKAENASNVFSSNADDWLYTKYAIQGALTDNSNPNLVGIEVSKPITMAWLLQTYHPEIVPIIIPKYAQYEIYSQEIMSITNVWNSVIASTVPSILSDLGLCSIAFMYNSANNAFAIGNIETFVQTTPAQLQSKSQALYLLLERDLFSQIRFNVGNFDVNCSCSTGGYCQIQLRLLDFGSSTDGGYYESNNLLGGINSAVVADADTCNKNATELGAFVQQFTNF